MKKKVINIDLQIHLPAILASLECGITARYWNVHPKQKQAPLICETLMQQIPKSDHLNLTLQEYNILKQCVCWSINDVPGTEQLLPALKNWRDFK